jgi:hypothetical protein
MTSCQRREKRGRANRTDCTSEDGECERRVDPVLPPTPGLGIQSRSGARSCVLPRSLLSVLDARFSIAALHPSSLIPLPVCCRIDTLPSRPLLSCSCTVCGCAGWVGSHQDALHLARTDVTGAVLWHASVFFGVLGDDLLLAGEIVVRE